MYKEEEDGEYEFLFLQFNTLEEKTEGVELYLLQQLTWYI